MCIPILIAIVIVSLIVMVIIGIAIGVVIWKRSEFVDTLQFLLCVMSACVSVC